MIIILAGVVGYFAYIKKLKPAVQRTTTLMPKQATDTPRPNSTPTPSLIIQNETFINYVYGYKIDLPNNWKMYSEFDGEVIASNPKNFLQEQLILTGEPPAVNFQINLDEGADINGTNNVGKSNKGFFLRDLSFVKNMTIKSGEVGQKYKSKSEDSYSFFMQTKKGLLTLTLDNNNLIFDNIISSLVLIK